MAEVTLTINGRLYDIACEDDQAERVLQLGREVDDRAQALLSQVGVVSDSRLLVMLCLLLADEAADLRAGSPTARAAASAAAQAAAARVDDERLAALLDQLAGRIETVATRLERA